MQEIIKTVNKLVRIHETRNPFKIAKYEGFILKFEDLDEIKGYYHKILRRKFIFINNNLDELSRHIVCAHELGHGILHNVAETKFMKEHTLFPIHSWVEKEANTFAAEMILNDYFEIDYFYNDGFPLDREVFEELCAIKTSNKRTISKSRGR